MKMEVHIELIFFKTIILYLLFCLFLYALI